MIRLLILGIALLIAEDCRAQATVVVSPARTGARGDGKHDDTAALRKLFTHLPNRPDVTIDLGSGTYLVSGSQLSSICGYYVLGLGVTTKLPPALHIKGKGARIVTNQKTGANLLAIVAKLSSLSVEGVTFERKEIATASDVNFTGGPGVYLTDSKAKRGINSVSFTNCRFINCHRGITVNSRFMDLTNDSQNPYYETAGLLAKLEINHCAFLYPYGSNSTATNGGSQALLIGNWVSKALVIGCNFDGAVGGSVANVPNHLPKDGFILASRGI